MKTLTAMLLTVLLCVGLTLPGFAADGTVSGETFAGKAPVQSIDFHAAAIQQHQDKAAVLEEKIQNLEHRLGTVKNSYRDPKGFRSASWKRMVATWRGELRDIRQRIVWHEEQIAQLKT